MATKTRDNNVETPASIGGAIDLSDFFGGENMWDDYDPSARGGSTFEPLPEGTYAATVVTMEGPMPNKKGTAHMLKVQYRIDDENFPEFTNRRLFQYISLQPQSKFNLVNTFAALGKTPGDTSYIPGEFDSVPCRLFVKVRAANGEYPASNEVKRVLPLYDEEDDTTAGSLW